MHGGQGSPQQPFILVILSILSLFSFFKNTEDRMTDGSRHTGAGQDAAAGGVHLVHPAADRWPGRAELRQVPGFEKSTVGASRFAPLVTSKYSRGFAPVTLAVITCGKRRMYVL